MRSSDDAKVEEHPAARVADQPKLSLEERVAALEALVPRLTVLIGETAPAAKAP